ncbi:VQ motif-containing protein 11 [Striga hermonthica]|uniref:VQ motif-containing protein 11 n=1 Tax=Striga hermonthica TaxID=68872 RepID=A0A9N7R721_STRHE|nr:VQ motif-containing protein 11 [Striga hermonthica]
MAASSSNNNGPNPNPIPNPSFRVFDPNSIPNTTFVQADPSTFRAVVQRLTGAAAAKPPGKPISGEVGPRRPAFKLHERRPTARKLEVKLGAAAAALNSPVSPLDYLSAAARGSPRTPMEEEERAIAEKGFYLHPSPLNTPRGSDPPELLPLFPLRSPRDNCG